MPLLDCASNENNVLKGVLINYNSYCILIEQMMSLLRNLFAQLNL